LVSRYLGKVAPLLHCWKTSSCRLKGVMDAPLSEEERFAGNRRNARMSKRVQAQLEEVSVHTLRDPHSSFEPEFVKKRETILSEGISERIIGLYALGTLDLSFLRVL
jgi:transposase-like protein